MRVGKFHFFRDLVAGLLLGVLCVDVLLLS